MYTKHVILIQLWGGPEWDLRSIDHYFVLCTLWNSLNIIKWINLKKGNCIPMYYLQLASLFWIFCSKVLSVCALSMHINLYLLLCLSHWPAPCSITSTRRRTWGVYWLGANEVKELKSPGGVRPNYCTIEKCTALCGNVLGMVDNKSTSLCCRFSPQSQNNIFFSS